MINRMGEMIDLQDRNLESKKQVEVICGIKNILMKHLKEKVMKYYRNLNKTIMNIKIENNKLC